MSTEEVFFQKFPLSLFVEDCVPVIEHSVISRILELSFFLRKMRLELHEFQKHTRSQLFFLSYCTS